MSFVSCIQKKYYADSLTLYVRHYMCYNTQSFVLSVLLCLVRFENLFASFAVRRNRRLTKQGSGNPSIKAVREKYSLDGGLSIRKDTAEPVLQNDKAPRTQTTERRY